MDKKLANRVLACRDRIVTSEFDDGDWTEVGLRTGLDAIIDGHHRLRRSLRWGDSDYSACVLDVLSSMADRDPSSLDIVEAVLDKKAPDGVVHVSASTSPKRLTFAPTVFDLPGGDIEVEQDLVALMMPFGAAFKGTHAAIQEACKSADLRCQRVDDIWDHTILVQDIFSLILRASIVVVDFTGKNPNVMYETGIAHTLGKNVVPISQSIDDAPFDVKHHRVLTYLPNGEGYAALSTALTKRLKKLSE